MNREKFNKIISEWEKSGNFKEYREEMGPKNKSLIKMVEKAKKSIFNEIDSETEDVIVELIKSNIRLKEVNGEDVCILEISPFKVKSRLINEYVKTIVHWNSFLYYFQIKEKYEICSKIKLMLDIFLDEIIKLLYNYHQVEDIDFIVIYESTLTANKLFFDDYND